MTLRSSATTSRRNRASDRFWRTPSARARSAAARERVPPPSRPAGRDADRAARRVRDDRLVVVLVVVAGGDPTLATARRRGHDLVLVGLCLGGDLVLGRLELRGVVDPGGLTVELLVGQLGVASVVLASRLLVAHCASLASWWWPLA